MATAYSLPTAICLPTLRTGLEKIANRPMTLNLTLGLSQEHGQYC